MNPSLPLHVIKLLSCQNEYGRSFGALIYKFNSADGVQSRAFSEGGCHSTDSFVVPTCSRLFKKKKKGEREKERERERERERRKATVLRKERRDSCVA